jgi:CO/xanthine dehydrogenase Mo-binding subunit
MSEASYVGKSINRVGGSARVSGRQLYAADIRLKEVLQVRLVSLDCARARIVSIDTTEASKVDGVRCVMTAADLPHPMPRFGPTYNDRPVLAVNETKYFGEALAVVAAETADAAEAAALLVRVEYEELPAVLSVRDALDPCSALVQDPALRPNDRLAETNIFSELHFGWGDVTKEQASLIVENDYTFPMVTHFAIEPHVFMAAPDENGITIWSPIQHLYVLQRVVASALGWPVARVRIIAPDPGGGFGGKGWPKFETLMAFLALKTGRAVRLVLTLEETFQAVRRASAEVHARTGFDSSGKILFQDIESNFLIGAYADVGPRVVSKASYVGCGPYKVVASRIISRALLSHTTPSTAFRGFGTPQASWAVESQMDEAARRLGLSAIEIRRRNLPNRGEEFIPNDTPADGDWKQCLERAAERIGWDNPLPPGRGRGISIGIKSSATASLSHALVRLHGDGSVSVMSGTSDMGQGARTVFTQLAADALGVAPDHITMVMGDTAVVPFDSSTSASRSTVFMGNAILRACEHVKDQLCEFAKELFGTDRVIALAEGKIWVDEEELTYAELLKAYYGSSNAEVLGMGSARSPFLPGHPLNGRPAFWEVLCAAVEVSVDRDTGMVEVAEISLVSDIGKALNPAQVESQDEGSAVMGLGHTLMEQLILDGHGRILNLGAIDYRIPTIQDTPAKIHSMLIENGDGPGPYGAKGTGEGGLLSIAAAIGSAITQATGVTIRDLPLTPEKIWRALYLKSLKTGRTEKPNAAQAESDFAGQNW